MDEKLYTVAKVCYESGWLETPAPGLLIVRMDWSAELDESETVSFKVLLRLEINESCNEGRAKSATLPGILPPR